MYNDAQSELSTLDYGVPQGSVLDPSLLCLLFNPIAHSFIDSRPSLYADDIEAHCSHSDLDVAQLKMNHDLKRVDQWLLRTGVIQNVKKTKSIAIGSRQAMKRANNIGIYLDSEMLDEVTTFDYLSVRICNILS